MRPEPVICLNPEKCPQFAADHCRHALPHTEDEFCQFCLYDEFGGKTCQPVNLVVVREEKELS